MTGSFETTARGTLLLLLPLLGSLLLLALMSPTRRVCAEEAAEGGSEAGDEAKGDDSGESGEAESGEAESGEAESGESAGDAEKESADKKKSKIPTRTVLDHKKKFVAYPRLGLIKVLGKGDAEGIDNFSVGMDVQVSFKRKFYISAEAQLLYMSSGEFGLFYDHETQQLSRFGQDHFTGLTALGAGMYTSFLDKQKFWTRFCIKGGYLYPFYIPVFLSGDIEKEFRRTRNSYVVLSLAPSAGALIPIRAPLNSLTFTANRDDQQNEMLNDASGFRIFVGAQISVAFIFAPRS